MCVFSLSLSLSLSLLQVGDDPMMAQVQLVAQKKLTLLREKEKELQQEVRFHSITLDTIH